MLLGTFQFQLLYVTERGMRVTLLLNVISLVETALLQWRGHEDQAKRMEEATVKGSIEKEY